jgi:hypothetical protein
MRIIGLVGVSTKTIFVWSEQAFSNAAVSAASTKLTSMPWRSVMVVKSR